MRCLAAIAMATQMAGAPAQTAADPYNYGRVSSFTYYGPADGALNGLIKSETVEPDRPQLCVTTSYSYDAFGNRVGASIANCPGATGKALFPTRAESTSYTQAGTTQSITIGGGSQGVDVAPGLFARTVTNAADHVEQRTHDPRYGAMVGLTGPNGLATAWRYDDFGRTTLELRADGTRTATAYCMLASAGVDTSSNSNTANGDPLDCPTPATGEPPADAALFSHSVLQDASGNVIGIFTRVYKDRLGRVLRTVSESFDGAAQAAGKSGVPVYKDVVFDAYGVKAMETQLYFASSGSSTTTGTSDVGVTRTVVDVLGRPVNVITSDPNGDSGWRDFGVYGQRRVAITNIEYTGLSVVTATDKDLARGVRRIEDKNVNGELLRVVDTTGATLIHQRDAFGNLIRTKDALGNITMQVFDLRGRKIRQDDPDSGSWEYAYDANGLLVWQRSANQAANGTETVLAYDVIGRLVRREEPEYVSTWAYDRNADGSPCMAGGASAGKGKLCQGAASNGLFRQYAYDSQGRLTGVRTSMASGPSFGSGVTYDARGRVSTRSYPTGLQLGYGYTPRGFLEKLVLKNAATVSPWPDAAGGVAAPVTLPADSVLWESRIVGAWAKPELDRYGNNVFNAVSFEAETGRVKALGSGTGNSVLSHRYGWDSLGNLTSRIDDNGDGASGAVSETFVYGDTLDRLTSYRVAAPAIPDGVRTVELQYNALGMLLYKSDVGNYRYGAQGGGTGSRPHALLGVAGAVNASYTYDANGNLSTASSGRYRSLSYTSFNLPDSSSGLQGAGVGYTWQYDENHERIRETRQDASGTRTTWSLHADNQGGLAFESESGPAGIMNRHYLTVGGQAVGVLVTTGALPVLPAGQIAPAVPAQVALTKIEYWHRDHLGSLITTTDHRGWVTARYAYDPFGKRREPQGRYDASGALLVDWAFNRNAGTDRGFTGHEHLDDVGIVHMNGRLFDPTLGVFLQPDPLVQDPSNLQNYNRYGYCYNNPLTCTDPTGLSFWTSFRGAFWRAVALVADLYGCNGYCSTAVGAVQGYSAGGFKGAVVGGVTAYVGAEYGAGFEPAQAGFFAVASGCLNAAAAGGKCGQGAVSGLIQYGMGSDDLLSSVAAGCVSSAATGGRCKDGAIDAFGAGLGTYAGNWVGVQARQFIDPPKPLTYIIEDGQVRIQLAGGAPSLPLEELLKNVRGIAIHEIFGVAVREQFPNAQIQVEYRLGDRGRIDLVINGTILIELKPGTVLDNPTAYADAKDQVKSYLQRLNVDRMAAGLPGNQATLGNLSDIAPNLTTLVYNTNIEWRGNRYSASVIFYSDPRKVTGLVFYDMMGNTTIKGKTYCWAPKKLGYGCYSIGS